MKTFKLTLTVTLTLDRITFLYEEFHAVSIAGVQNTEFHLKHSSWLPGYLGKRGLSATSSSSLKAKQRLYRSFFYLISPLGENQKISLTVKFHLGLTPTDLLTSMHSHVSGRKIFRSFRIQGQNSGSYLNFPNWPSNDLEDQGQDQFQGLHPVSCLISYNFCEKSFSWKLDPAKLSSGCHIY